jgi:hypothetical protein
MPAKLQAIQVQLRLRMRLPWIEQAKWLQSVVAGWCQSHAVPANLKCLVQFQTPVGRRWLRALRRRNHKGGQKWTWVRMARLIRKWVPRVRTMHPYPDQRLLVRT